MASIAFPRRFSRRAAAVLAAGTLCSAGLTALSAVPASAGAGLAQFAASGTFTWTVPQGVGVVTLGVVGAQGGGGSDGYGVGGKGGFSEGTFAVSPGQVLTIVVGGTASGINGGYGGGGSGVDYDEWYQAPMSFGGGGASRVSIGSQLLVVGGGGGGAAYGAGGGPSGGTGGDAGGEHDGRGGKGAAPQSGAGGAGGLASTGDYACWFDGNPGMAGNAAGQGGSGGPGSPPKWTYWTISPGGGGGGGLFGGGGGGSSAVCEGDVYSFRHGGGGGGGSSFVHPSATNASITQGVGTDNGFVAISFNDVNGPTSAPVVAPSPNAAGWNNTDVQVNWNWTDPSGLNTCTTVTTIRQTANLVASANCQDRAGNSSTAFLPVSVKIDKLAPQAARTFTAGSVTWNWSDAGGSGLKSSTCPATTLFGSATSVTCYDIAGNSTTFAIPPS